MLLVVKILVRKQFKHAAISMRGTIRAKGNGCVCIVTILLYALGKRVVACCN